MPAKLEQTMGLGRNSWPLSAIRQMADAFLAAADGRKKSPAYEVRWLNLAGFCLRPGFGYPGDDFRIEQARRVYAAGITYGNQVQCEIDWWIFWGRVAGGLNRNQQTDIYQRLSAFLLPRGNKKPQRVNPSLLREMWRTRVQPGTAAHRHQDRTRRGAGEARQGRRLQGERTLVPVAPGRAQALLRTHQPGDAARHRRALGGGAAPHSRRGRRAGRHGAPHRRSHARSARSHSRMRCAPSCKPCRMPTACWPCSTATKRTTARSAAFSARNCPRAWCWWKPLRRARFSLPPVSGPSQLVQNLARRHRGAQSCDAFGA